jgi:hypothetical protein
MAKSKASLEPFDIGCPCCGASIKIDPETRGVISHIPPVKPKTFENFEAAAKALRDQDTRRESLFQQSVEAEKNKADLLEKKFQEAMRKAKETPDTGKPFRDFDLD